jgi:hypothetical protein
VQERDELLATLITAEAVDPKLHPRQALLSRDVPLVRRSDRFRDDRSRDRSWPQVGQWIHDAVRARGERWCVSVPRQSWIA